jgi:hypothetical protein
MKTEHDKERERIAKAVEEYLASGGTIKIISDEEVRNSEVQRIGPNKRNNYNYYWGGQAQRLYEFETNFAG